MSRTMALAAELQFECGRTRQHLLRLPAADWNWRPHAKSWTLGELASHLVEILRWVGPTLEEDEFFMNPAEYVPWRGQTPEEVVAAFDEAAGQAMEQLAAYPEERLDAIWRMRSPEKILLEMPRGAVLRGFIFSHLVHHRGQLTVYLRMRDVPLAQTYGPTADETEMDMG